jgi:hypothetical protein
VCTLTAPGARVRSEVRGMPNTGLVPVEEAAKRLKVLGVGRDATYGLARKHGVRIGKRLYLPRALVEGLVAGDLEALRIIREGRGAK